MTGEFYDVVVLGGGAGGVPAAIRAAQLGGRTALIECSHLGGLCMNRGCVPFSQMMVASNILGSLLLGRNMGLNLIHVSNDYDALIKRKDELINYMRLGVKTTLRSRGVKILEGSGKIIRKGKIKVGAQETIRCRKIILATGAKWIEPYFLGSDIEEVVDSDYLLTAKTLPEKVLLFGKSQRTIEIAQMLRRFGSEVFLVTQDKSLLAEESRTIRSRVTKVLIKEGITIKTGCEIVSAIKENGGLSIQLKTKEGPDKVYVNRVIHTERRASLKNLGLENIGLDEEGEHLSVNARMETDSEGVYAIGDITGPPSRHYSHLASAQGIIAAENAMGNNSSINPRTLVKILFTQPQVASVGLTAKTAKSQYYDVVTGSAPLSMNPLGMVIEESEGIIEIVAEKAGGKVLGVHFVAKNASEMVGQALIAIEMGATLERLSRVSFPHPTLSESLAEAARDALGRPIYLP